MLTISKILSSDGNKKEKIDKKRERNKGREDKTWNKIIESKKDNGNSGKGSWKEKKRNRRDRRVNLNIYVKSFKKIYKD